MAFQNFFSSKIGQWMGLLLLSLVWGSSFILMKKGLVSFHSLHVASLRLGISFLALLPFIFKLLKKFKLRHLKSFLLVSLLGIAIPAFLFPIAQTKISSSASGMINALTPACTVLIGALFYRVPAKWYHLLGVLLGLLGALFLSALKSGGQLGEVNVYALLIVAATIGYGLGTNEIKAGLQEFNGIEITTLSFLFAGPPAILYLGFSDYSYISVSNELWFSLIAVGILALLGSVLALFLFNTLVHATSAVFAASVTYIIPVVAIMWGVMDGEGFSYFHFAGISAILIGVYIINMKPKKNLEAESVPKAKTR